MNKKARRTRLFHPLPIFLILSIVVFGGVTLFAQRTLPDSNRLAKLVQVGHYADVETTLEGLLVQSTTDLSLNYSYINNHFNIPANASGGRDDQKLISRYTDLAGQPLTADLGNYGLGLIESLLNNYDKALGYLQKVQNPQMLYLNNSLGYIYAQRQDYAKAEQYYQAEVANNGNVPAAANNLAILYLQTNNIAQLKALAGNAQTAQYLRPDFLRILAFRTGDLIRYLQLVFVVPLVRISPEAWLDALLVSLLGLFFFWRTDLLPGKFAWRTALILLLGFLAALVFYILSDVFEYIWMIYPNGRWWNDLSYYVLQPGLARELSKILPVLLLTWFTRWVRGPKDIIVYGNLSVLGFSFLENAQHFSQPGPGMAFSYFLLDLILNLATTSIICYLWIYRRYTMKRDPFWMILAGLLLAALIHGWFDDFLLSRFSQQFLLSMVVAVVMGVLYGWMLKNALLATDYYRVEHPFNLRLIAYEWILSLTLVFCLAAFIIDNFNFSTQIAEEFLLRTLFTSLLLAALVFAGLGELGLSPANLLPAISSTIKDPTKPGERN